jgi:anti-sigma regulatory factor (Ser/Thr protein kinase)
LAHGSPTDGSTETVEWARDPGQLAAVRAWVAGFFSTRPARPEIVEDLVVMVGELVANVLEHTQCAATVTLSVEPDAFRVTVHDDDPHDPELQPVDATRVGGNGLRIIDAWATGWGVEHTGDGKDVWITVRRW